MRLARVRFCHDKHYQLSFPTRITVTVPCRCGSQGFDPTKFPVSAGMLDFFWDILKSILCFILLQKLEFCRDSAWWEGPFEAPLVGAAAAALPDGRILLWSAYAKYVYYGNTGDGYTWSTIFDPFDRSFSETRISDTAHDMFCPGLAFLENGMLMVTGGSNSEETSMYVPTNNTWVSDSRMQIARGYHSMATLANGDIFTVGGSWSGAKEFGNRNGEVWSNGAWNRKNGILSDEMGTAELIVRNRDYYMWIYQAPNGRIFQAGPSQQMHWIDIEGEGSFEGAGLRGDDEDAMNGNAVMFDVGKILTVGGGLDFESGSRATRRSYVIDINADTAHVQRSGDMAHARTFANSIVLPTGEVAVIGGKTEAVIFSDNNAIHVAEIWNPDTGKWTVDEKMMVPRVYHSVALLAKDGTIIAAGGGLCKTKCDANHADVEVFIPPYLRKVDDRPVIEETSVSDILPGDSVSVTMATDEDVTFALIRASAVTHSSNFDQRRIPLQILNQTGTVFQLQIPDNANIVIPGPYFLFAMYATGTPSIGANMLVRI